MYVNQESCYELQRSRHDECNPFHFIVSEDIQGYLRNNKFYPRFNTQNSLDELGSKCTHSSPLPAAENFVTNSGLVSTV